MFFLRSLQYNNILQGKPYNTINSINNFKKLPCFIEDIGLGLAKSNTKFKDLQIIS